MLTINGEIICVDNMVYSSLWKANLINSDDFSIKEKVNLSSNPSASTNEILVDAYLLAYGLYEFIFQVKGNWNGIEKVFSQSTYRKIIPTGIAVFGLENGVSSTTIGLKQLFLLNPSKFSFDFDYVASMQTLKFDFYCRKLFKNQTNSTILLQYLNNNTFIYNSQYCFNKSGNLK